MELSTSFMSARIPADLHRRAKATAAARGISLKDAMAAAFELWLAAMEGEAASPAADLLSSKERALLDTALQAIRSKSHRGQLITSILETERLDMLENQRASEVKKNVGARHKAG